MPAELEAETAVQRASRGEILTVAIAVLLLMVIEVLGKQAADFVRALLVLSTRCGPNSSNRIQAFGTLS